MALTTHAFDLTISESDLETPDTSLIDVVNPGLLTHPRAGIPGKEADQKEARR